MIQSPRLTTPLFGFSIVISRSVLPKNQLPQFRNFSTRKAPILRPNQPDFYEKLKQLKAEIIDHNSGVIAFKIADISDFESSIEQQKKISAITKTVSPAFSVPSSLEELSIIMPKAVKFFQDMFFDGSIGSPHTFFGENGEETYSSLILMNAGDLESKRGPIHRDFAGKPIIASFVCNILGSSPSGEPLTSISVLPIADIVAKLDSEVISILTDSSNFIFKNNRETPMAPIGLNNGHYLVNYFLEVGPNQNHSLIPQNDAAKEAYQKLIDTAVALVGSDKAIRIDCDSKSVVALNNKHSVHCRDEGKTPSTSVQQNGNLAVRVAFTGQLVEKRR